MIQSGKETVVDIQIFSIKISVYKATYHSVSYNGPPRLPPVSGMSGRLRGRRMPLPVKTTRWSRDLSHALRMRRGDPGGFAAKS